MSPVLMVNDLLAEDTLNEPFPHVLELFDHASSRKLRKRGSLVPCICHPVTFVEAEFQVNAISSIGEGSTADMFHIV
jgi:hypothetical protein